MNSSDGWSKYPNNCQTQNAIIGNHSISRELITLKDLVSPLMEIFNLNLLFWCIHFDLLSLIWKINVWNNSLLIYWRKNKLLFPCLYSDQPSLCHVSVRLEKTKCITCKCQKRIFYSQFNCGGSTYYTCWPRSTQTTMPHSPLCWLWHSVWVAPHIIWVTQCIMLTQLSTIDE